MKKIIFILLCLLLCPGWGWAAWSLTSDVDSDKDIRKQFWQAVLSNNTEKAKKLIRREKSLVFISNQAGRTGYLLAVEKGNKKMAWFLAESFSHTQAKCERGNALHIAVENKDFSMLKLAMKAAQVQDEDLLPRLINTPRATAKRGQMAADMNTPLHLAALNCERQMYRYLVQFGGNEKAINAKLQTPPELLKACPQVTLPSTSKDAASTKSNTAKKSK